MILKENFQIKIYYLMSHHILSHYKLFGMEFNTNLFIFYHSSLSTSPCFLYFKNSLWKVGVFLLKNNYTYIFIIKLLMYNYFEILNLISFIIHYRCPKKGHLQIWAPWLKKWATLMCIHPSRCNKIWWPAYIYNFWQNIHAWCLLNV